MNGTTDDPVSSASSRTVAVGCGRRRVPDKLPTALWLVAVIGFWERAAFWGISAPWQNYMEHPRHHDMEHTPGALNLGQAMATRTYCAFFILYFVTPIFIAPLADNWLGQYMTLLVSSVVYCLGCLTLTISSLPSSLDRDWGLPGFILSIVLIGLGAGGFQVTIRSFIANQYTDREPKLRTLKSGEEVVTDPELTVQYIYSLYFWVGNVGALWVFITIYLEKQCGFAEAYGLGLGFIIIAVLMLIFLKSRVNRKAHTDSVMIPAVKILTCAVRNGFKMERADPDYQYMHHKKEVSWDSGFVHELKGGLGACRVLLAFVVYYVCFDQMQNNLISQASQMNTGNTPNDLLPAMNQVACIILAPLIAHGLYPWLEKKGIYLKPVTRITIGFIFITLSMLYAAAVQHAIYQSGPCYEYPKDCNTKIESKGDRPDVWMQLPLYFLLAASEVFGMTTAMEYAEKHAPKGMQVLVQAINMLIMGAGSAVALAIAEAARDPYLVWFYTALTIGMAIATLIFFLIFRNYDRDHPTTAPDSETVTVTEKESVSTTPFTSYPASVRSSVHGPVTQVPEKETESVPASVAHPAVMSEQASHSRTNAANAAGEDDRS